MAKYTEFYRGKRKKRNLALIPSVIIIGIITLTVVLFYSMQKYAVISKDGIEVKLPILESEETIIDDEGKEVKVFDKVETELVLDPADYSDVEAEAGEDVPELRAIFVPYTDLNEEKLNEYANRLNAGNALVLEMKPRSGQLMWNSMAVEALNYGLSMPTETTNAMPQLIKNLKGGGEGNEQGEEGEAKKKIYLVAQISCCLDELFASRSTSVALRTEYGANYIDENGTWLDPYNQSVRDYTVQLAKELFEMGFDEVVLKDVAHPILPTEEDKKVNLVYTRQMSTTPGPVNAVCGFAVYVAEQLRDVNGVISIYCDTRKSLVGPDETNGQDATLFMKLFDRVYLPTDKFTYSYNVSDIQPHVEIGDVHNRLVPVVENLIPHDNSSWVLIDVEEEEEED